MPIPVPMTEFPRPEECVLPLILRGQALRTPREPFATSGDGSSWTPGQTWQRSLEVVSEQALTTGLLG
jgi:hypothetical protein